MIKCLIVSSKPYLFEALSSIDDITSKLTLTHSTELKPGFELIISDKKLRTKTHSITLADRPIQLWAAMQEIETYINSLSKQLRFADAILDIAARQLFYLDSSISLTEIECKILSALITAPNHSLNRDEIKTSVLGYNEDVQTSTIENHIYHLRQKLNSYSLKIDRVDNEYRLAS